ncbi:MAG TPA: LysR family transcriptional regulator [Feifaniaceae bacterium]|nr:LysR family transcriptional regulator [Feifaniaceae bacterium]
MNFTSLKYFLVVTEELNVTRAAKRLYISQQSLSAHIAALEKDLNVKLFDRTPVFALTYAGVRLETFARKILDLERQAYSEMDDIAGQRRGALRIGMSHTCGRAILPKILPGFHEKNPFIETSVMEGNSAELEDHLKHGRIDLMIVFTPVTLESVEIIPLAVERLLLLVPRKLSKTLFGEHSEYMRGKFSISADISCFEDMPFILLKKGNRIRSLIDGYTSSRGVKLNVLFETENTETAYALAQNGMGIAVYPELFLKHIHGMNPGEDETVDYFPITDASASGTLAICYDRSRYLSNAARDFIKIACDALRE